MSQDEITNENQLHIQIQMLIYSPASTIKINIKTGAISSADGEIAGISIYNVIGGKDLSRNWMPRKIYKRIVNNAYPSRNPKRTSIIFDKEISGFESLSMQMSIIYPCTPEECKRILEPFLLQGIQKCYLYTLANSRHLGNDFTEEKYGFKNEWLCSGSPPDPNDWSFVNGLLKKKGSIYRVRCPEIFMVRLLSDI